METMIGKTITYANADWKVTSFTPMTEYPNMARTCENTGKYPVFFLV